MEHERRRIYSFLGGIGIGIFLLLFTFIVPYTEITLFTLVPSEGGTRLHISGAHIHHYFFGIAILIVGLWIIFRGGDSGYFFLGLGAVLILDEVPDILRGGLFFE